MPIPNYYVVLPGHTGTYEATSLGSTVTIDFYDDPVEQAPATTFSAQGNEIAVLDFAVVSPSKGKAIARTGGGTTLDLKAVDGPQTITAQTPTGDPIQIDVLARNSKDPWPSADVYQIEKDPATGDLVIEPGRNHSVIYTSQSTEAYDETAIASEYNTANGTSLAASDITPAWLIEHPEYGATSAKALKWSLAYKLIAGQNLEDRVYPSLHLYFECGYSYGTIPPQIHGESPLHPHVIRKWGTGADPAKVTISGNDPLYPSNIVVIGFRAGIGRNFKNLMFADMTWDGTKNTGIVYHDGQRSSMITLYRTMAHNASKNPTGTDANGNPVYLAHQDRVSGTFILGTKGVFLDKCVWWRNGWQPNFGQNREGNLGQPPDEFSHNQYLHPSITDMTVRSDFSIQGASGGVMFHGGAWYLDSISADNNMQGSGGGQTASSTDNLRGQPSNMHRIVGTSARHDALSGAKARGFHDVSSNTEAITDLLVMHLANPDDAAEITAKTVRDKAISDPRKSLPNFNAVVWKWDADYNTDGLDAVAMDTTTIQRFAESVMGAPATVGEFGEWLVTQTPQQRAAIHKQAMEYFLTPIASKLHGRPQDPYGSRATSVHQVFDAWPGTEGFRWDNPLHWSEKWVPGQNDLDSADLNGNDVKFIADTRKLDSLTFNGGHLLVSSGKLTVGTHADAAKVTVHNCGQYVAGGGGDFILREGGRLVLPENASFGAEASGQSELCLPLAATVPAGKALRIVGGMGWAGWDQTSGTATLTVNGALEFEVTPVLTFDSPPTPWDLELDGKFLGETSGFTGVYDSIRVRTQPGKPRLPATRVMVRGASGVPSVGEVIMRRNYFQYMADAGTDKTLVGTLPGKIGALELFRSGRNGLTAPAVTGSLVLAAGSTVSIIGQSYLAAGTYDLTGPGITVTDQGATLPAGVTVTGGKLVLTV